MNKILEISKTTWVAIVILCDNMCAAISVQLMWEHLNEINEFSEQRTKLPRKRFYFVVACLIGHAFLDILALVVHSIGKFIPSLSTSPEQSFFMTYFSSSLTAYHVGFYPFVYCAVRDLKFRNQIKERESTNTSPVKDAVNRVLARANTKTTFTSKTKTGNSVPLVKASSPDIQDQ